MRIPGIPASMGSAQALAIDLSRAWHQKASAAFSADNLDRK